MTTPNNSDVSSTEPLAPSAAPKSGKVTKVASSASVGLLLLFFGCGLIILVAFVRFYEVLRGRVRSYISWMDLVSGELTTLILLFLASGILFVAYRLLTSSQYVSSPGIPKEDYDLIRDAVIDGRAEPIDMYVKLRSLVGWSGTFTKLGITGLPLTTVFLTIFFSLLSLVPGKTQAFMDLTKLTLGAFIGSFVQRTVEQRGHNSSKPSTTEASYPNDVA